MLQPNSFDLKYGVIYVFYNPYLRTDSVGGMSIIEKIAHPFQIQWIEDPDRSKDNTLLVARRFNVGNMGRCATVSLHLSDDNRHGGQFEALHEFRNKLFEVIDMDNEDIVLDDKAFANKYFDYFPQQGVCYEAAPPQPSAAPQDKTRVKKHNKRLAEKTAEWFKTEVFHAKKSKKSLIEDEPDLLQEESLEIKRIESEKKRELERIRRDIINYIAQYQEDPQDLMVELLRGKVVVGTPGRVLVNGDMKIVLPEYDELEIEMPAMCRTLYILFMKQRKQGDGGIILRNIDEYRDELLNIYSLVKPGANEIRVVHSVDNLCEPFGEALNQTISRINRCIRNVITDKELARQYIITGNRGEQYGIALDPEWMELPRAVTNQ